MEAKDIEVLEVGVATLFYASLQLRSVTPKTLASGSVGAHKAALEHNYTHSDDGPATPLRIHVPM